MDPALLQALQAGYKPVDLGFGKPKPKGGRGGFLTSLISEGGAVGGAALGTAILPGVGTILGAGLGALGGRLTENKVRDNRLGIGDAAKEAALSGAFAGVAPAFKAIKGGASAIKGGGGLADAVMAAKGRFGAAPAAGVSKLAKTSESLKSGVINPKTKASVFGASEDANIVKIVDKYVKGSNATQKYRNLESAFTGLSDDIQKVLTPVKAKTTAVDFTKKMTQSLADDINYIPGDAAYERELGRVLNKVASFGKGGNINAKGLFEAKQYLGSQLKGAFGKNGADLSVPQQVRMAVWERLDDSITTLAPRVKELTTAQSMLIKSAPGLQKSASKSLGAPILGVKSKLAERMLQTGQYTTAKGLGAASNVASATAPLARAAVPQFLGRGLVGGQELNAPSTASTTQPIMATTSMPANSSTILDQSYSNNDQMSSASSPFDVENLEDAIMKIAGSGGTLKDISEFLSVAKTVNELKSVKNGAKKLNSTQQQQSNNAISALNDLQIIRDELSRDPSVAGKAALPGGSFTQRLTGSGQFESAKKNIGDVLARLRSGAAITDDEYKRYVALLPSTFDTPQLAEQKIGRLEQLLGSFAFEMNGAGGSAGTLEDALMQYAN